jgi:phosphatidylglycerophosphatase GEP4
MINWDALSYFPIVWLDRPQLAVPHTTVSRLSDIDVAGLVASGVTGILVDYDDTLVSSKNGELFADSGEFAARCVHAWGDRACVFSDTAGTHRDVGNRIALSIERRLGMSTLLHRRDKPGGIEAVYERFGREPGRLAIVGDRLLTDVVFGNRYGFRTIWLRHAEPVGTFSGLERRLFARRA